MEAPFFSVSPNVYPGRSCAAASPCSAPAAGCLAGLFGGLALFPEGCLADLDALSGCPLEQLAEETAAR